MRHHNSCYKTLNHTGDCCTDPQIALYFKKKFVLPHHFDYSQQTKDFDHTIQTRQSYEADQLVVVSAVVIFECLDYLPTARNVLQLLFFGDDEQTYPLNWQN